MAKKTNGKKEEKALVKTGAGAIGKPMDYGDDFGGGFGNQTQDDISIPFIDVLQSNSPQVSDFEDARPGMLFNTVTNQFIDPKKGVVFVPATTQHKFVEWVPRDEGGGFVAVHEIDSEVVRKAKAEAKEKFKYKVGKNDLVETFYVYCAILDENGEANGDMAVLAFRSTKIKVYKRWNTSVKMFTVKTPSGAKKNPPLFAHTVRLTSVPDKNAKGNFYNFHLAPANGSIEKSLLVPGDPRLDAAKSLCDLVETGAASAAHATEGAAGNGGDGDGEEAF